MTSRGAATRYARALFDVTRNEHKDLQKTQADLRAFATLVAENPALQRVLINPAIPAARKRAVLEQLLALSPVSPDRLARPPDAGRSRPARPARGCRGRLPLAPDGSPAGRPRREVTTAVALPADRVQALEQGLAQATGQQVQLDTRVDDAIVGGAVARLGGTVYDGSITRSSRR